MTKTANQNCISLTYNPVDFENAFLNILKEYGAEHVTCLAISQDTAIRLASISLISKTRYQFPEFFDFQEHGNNGLVQAVASQTIFYIDNQDEITTYVEDSKHEIYIPVIINDRLHSIICFSAKNPISKQININEITALVSSFCYYINYIRVEKILNKNIIKYITLLDKLYSEKTHHMIQHSYNVALWATEIASQLNYDETKIKRLYLAALLHDIGNIYIDSDIVNKVGEYSKEEYEIQKKHVTYGYEICKDLFLGYHENISIWIYQHHEKWNGKGYPKQLIGEEISEEARILQVAESLDGMLSWRSYKSKMSFNQVINELRRCSGKDFDPSIVDIAIAAIKQRLDVKNNILNEFIMPASLIVNLKEDAGVINLSGYISKANDELVFISDNSKAQVAQDKIDTLVLSVEKFNVITEYKITVKRIESNTYTINYITEKEQEKSFSLLWILEGALIDFKTKEAHDILITKISANGVVFSFKEEEATANTEQTYLVAIIFEDNTKLGISGTITKTTVINKRVHYELSFISLKESEQAQIFHQLFQKQISIRKLLK